MGDRYFKAERQGYSDSQIVETFFPKIWARRFWCGVAVGVVAMSMFDIVDLHICVGDCDAAGYDLWPNVDLR